MTYTELSGRLTGENDMTSCSGVTRQSALPFHIQIQIHFQIQNLKQDFAYKM